MPVGRAMIIAAVFANVAAGNALCDSGCGYSVKHGEPGSMSIDELDHLLLGGQAHPLKAGLQPAMGDFESELLSADRDR